MDEQDEEGIMAIRWSEEADSACGIGCDPVQVAEFGPLRAEVSERSDGAGCLWSVYHGEEFVTNGEAADITDAIRLATLYLITHAPEWVEPDWADGAVPE